jgi:LysR family transcriptional regulator, regulator for bpeEF and oprC
MSRIRNLSVLIRVAETGSFSRCAEAMGVGQPTISKAVDALERDLGIKLLNRSTRSLSLTEDGRRIYGEAKKVIDSYDDLLASANLKSVPKGLVRITCPNALGSLYLIPRLRQFMKEHSAIQVQLRVTDSFLDLYDNDIDVSFRIGEIHSGQFIAKRVGNLPRIAVASRRYLREYPAPQSLADLKSHRCISVSRSASASVWTGTSETGRQFALNVNGSLIVDNHLAVRPAVESGLGIGLATKFIFEDHGKLGRGLEQVLKKVRFKSFPMHILFKESKNLPSRVRVLVDFFYEDLQRQQWLEK